MSAPWRCSAAALLLQASLALACLLPAHAEELRLSEHPRLPLELDTHVEVLEDRSGALSFAELQMRAGRGAEGFTPGTAARMRQGFSKSAFWLRLSLSNDGDDVQQLRLVLDTTWLQYADFYVLRRGGFQGDGQVWRHESSGVSRPHALRGDRVPTLAIDNMQPGEHAIVLVRVQSGSSLKLAPVLHSVDSLRTTETRRALIDGLLIGGLLVLAVYSLALWAISRKTAMGSQSLGFALVALYEATYRGYARPLFWPDSTEWSYRAAGVVAGCCVLNMVVYLHVLSRRAPVRPPGLRALVALAAVQGGIVFGTLVGPYAPFAKAGTLSALLLVLALTVSSFVYMRRAGPGGRLAFPVMVVVLLGVCLRLVELNVPAHAIPGFDAYVLGFPGLLVGLVALAAWTHHLSQQRLAAQRKLVRWQAREQGRLKDEVIRKTRALNSALEQAEHRSREQTRLMAYIGHDLRAPLATIVGHARVLRDALGKPMAPLEAIERSAHYQLALVDDLLDYAKGELMPLELDPQPVRLPVLIDDIAQQATMLARRQNNVFTLEVRGPLAPLVRLDRKRFQQLLLNLLSNAAKFTRDGQMGLRIGTRAEGDQWRLDVEVWDSGIGIDRKDQRRVFRAFAQADPAVDGSGLGLAIARRIVGRMGAELRLESRRNLGTRVHFSVLLDGAAVPASDDLPWGHGLSPQPLREGPRARRAGPQIAPLPAEVRRDLETMARDGRWTDLHEWMNRLAPDPAHAPLVQAVRQALDALDFEQILYMARAAPEKP
ncbi:hypothetical protein RT97_04990 [Variovorax paradoxus]|uniref:histidine kinase n=1 Tax=Variovorax paradoxus TaxID=34073 RepID=A0A0D0M0U3_VARPD|nr:7TM-DISM domain-containing protein [Variovorax paradoxus]KIQ35268.1 hypothetical protein RT97_04990 [Variovorax paradoxus]